MPEVAIGKRPELVRSIIREGRYLSLATTDGSDPWVAPVEYVADAALNLYFVSLHASRHAQHIDANPTVAVAIFDLVSRSSPGAAYRSAAGDAVLGSRQSLRQCCRSGRHASRHCRARPRVPRLSNPAAGVLPGPGLRRRRVARRARGGRDADLSAAPGQMPASQPPAPASLFDWRQMKRVPPGTTTRPTRPSTSALSSQAAALTPANVGQLHLRAFAGAVVVHDQTAAALVLVNVVHRVGRGVAQAGEPISDVEHRLSGLGQSSR